MIRSRLDTMKLSLPTSLRRQMDFGKAYGDKHEADLYSRLDQRMGHPIIDSHPSDAYLTETSKMPLMVPMDNNLRYLPKDFTIDETIGLPERVTEPLSEEIFQHIRTISKKMSENPANLSLQLTENESKFIG